MQNQPGPPDTPPDSNGGAGEFRWLPASRFKRALVWLGLAGFVAITFNAYLHPNMVFDLANMVFCG